MKPITKAGLVGAGYIIAVVVATAAVAFRVMAINDPATQSQAGMTAFGDGLLFHVVFGLAAVLPTGAALFFLRPYRAFWRGFSVVALGVALTSLAAFIAMSVGPRSVAAGLAFPRILVAPLFALAFGLTGLFAPNRGSRIALFVATGMEATAFACWVGACLLRNLTNV